MTKLSSKSIAGAKRARTVMGALTNDSFPRPVTAGGVTPVLWRDVERYEWTVDLTTGDDQDFLDAIESGVKSGKIKPATDNTEAKVRAKLAAEIAAAKAARLAKEAKDKGDKTPKTPKAPKS